MVPEGWKQYLGSEITSKITKGSSPKWQGFDYQDYGVLFITSENVRDGYLDVSTPKYLPIEFNDKLKNSQLEYGDILINIVGASIGRSCQYLLAEQQANINQAVCLFRINSLALSDYIRQYLQLPSTVRKLRGAQSDSARPNLSLSDMRNFIFVLPGIPEQKKIAQILSTWDKAITTTEQLLANSQQQKKALMQQLLTGKKRLLDENGVRFSGEWKRVALGDVFQKISNGVTYDAKATEGLPVSRIETISTGTINYDKVGWAPNTENTKRFRLHAGDILYSHINSLEHIGRVAYFSDEQPLFHGMNLLLLRAKSNQNSRFYYYLLGSDIGKRLAKTRAKSAVNQASISTTDLKMYFVYAPSFDEQEKIASVLSVIDEEVSKLQQKLEALKQEKKALMQQLLTGKRRVKVDEEAA